MVHIVTTTAFDGDPSTIEDFYRRILAAARTFTGDATSSSAPTLLRRHRDDFVNVYDWHDPERPDVVRWHFDAPQAARAWAEQVRGAFPVGRVVIQLSETP